MKRLETAPASIPPSDTAALRIAPPGMTLATAGAWLGARLSAAAQRVQGMAVPAESVPSGWQAVPVMDRSHLAAASDAMVAGDTSDSGEDGEGALGDARLRLAPRATAARSIKNGPPKAPRTRAAVAVAMPPSAPALLPADVVPVMSVALHEAPTERVELPPIVVAMPVAMPDKSRVIDPGHSPGVERASSTLAQRIGDDAERLAAIRLEALGWRIVARNLRLIRAEIDLLAIDPAQPATLVIVEVRRRSRRDFGIAEETVDFRKRAALRRAAGELAIRPVLPDGRRLPNLPVRVDLIAIDRGPDGRPSLRHHRGIEL